MRNSPPTDLGRELVRFFEEYLPAQRGLSPHTVRSYRDALLLLLQFASRDAKRPIERLDIADLNAERVVKFLGFLETARKNSIATRNARLGAIHVFARFLAAHRPERLGTLQRVIALPFKRGARDAPIEYLERTELEALFKSIDRNRPHGRRDYALFALMFNTGARVQEVLDLRRRDVRLDAPCQVRLHGKGNKVRLCPIWPMVARLLRNLISETRSAAGADPADALLFSNARGGPLTRYGVRYLLRKYLAAAGRLAPTLRDKRLHPHSLRHSTAVALLKSGVDFATISQWLGHAGLNTTMRYARADIDLKRQALSQVFPDALTPPRGGRLLINGAGLAGWLRRM
jgi:integrase/recombinase XerD